MSDWKKEMNAPALVYIDEAGVLLGPSVPFLPRTRLVWAERHMDGEWYAMTPLDEYQHELYSEMVTRRAYERGVAQ